jgi:hypothetical protein
MTPLVLEISKLAGPALDGAMWFDLGALGGDEQTITPEGLNDRWPFDRCALVFCDGDGNKGLMLAAQRHGATVLTSWLLGERKVLRAGHMVQYYVAEDQVYMEGGMVAFQCPEVAVAIEFLRRMRAGGTHAYDRNIPDTATNRRKLSEGKPPSTYAWRTVVVAPTQPRKLSAGGSHASPRLHERRGHWRHLHSGDAVWVRPCLVGSPERGVVEKDYRVPNAQVNAPLAPEEN